MTILKKIMRIAVVLAATALALVLLVALVLQTPWGSERARRFADLAFGKPASTL